jgi:hypothetical protein
LFTRAALGEDAGRLAPMARALLAIRGRTLDDTKDDDVNDVDGKLVGWPWAEGNFSWVEPTSWATLALRRIGQGGQARVKEGQSLLLDRTLGPGGLNYGNRRIFGITLEPIPTPTALGMLALQGSGDERAAKSLAYLERAAGESNDVDHLAWSILALDANGRGPLDGLRRSLRDAVEARKKVPYLRASVVKEALACLALREDNPFRLPEVADASLLEPGKLAAPAWSLGGWAGSVVQGIAVFATGALRAVEAASPVHIADAQSYDGDLAGVMARQYEGFRERVPLKGRRVVLKPNLVEYHRDKVINTDPRFVGGVIELCKREGRRRWSSPRGRGTGATWSTLSRRPAWATCCGGTGCRSSTSTTTSRSSGPTSGG